MTTAVPKQPPRHPPSPPPPPAALLINLVSCLCVVTRRFNHELVFGISVKNLTKAERLIYSDSLMTHAMILTAVTDKVTLTQLHATWTGTANTSKNMS